MNFAAARTLPCLAVLLAVGCRSGYYQSQGTGVGALGGAGVGALVGSATGDAGTGALIGAGVGALTGNVVGGAMDDVEARNRAQIAATMGRPPATGAATAGEVVAMSRAGVDPQLIVNYINTSGVAQPASPQDVIFMTQQGVPPMVIQAMQTPRVAQAQAVVVPPPPPGPVVVEEVYYGPPPCFGPPCWGHRCGPRVGWGVSFSN
ncbi:MAG: glycine zipper domain-containing protein [Pirellulales bacterium]